MNIVDKFRLWKRKQRWNSQYKNGKWEKLKGKEEAERYKTIGDFVLKSAPNNATLLELGCGEGILLHYLKAVNYKKYIGIDFSQVSITSAKTLNYKNTEFICADIHTYKPELLFDAIIFNESFYYIHKNERAKVLNTVLAHLKPNGLVINSVYKDKFNCWPYFEKDLLKHLEFKTITGSHPENFWKIGVYKKI
ncbi:class I SAM-dependent methyltransferase [Lacinutrix salivirga]